MTFSKITEIITLPKVLLSIIYDYAKNSYCSVHIIPKRLCRHITSNTFNIDDSNLDMALTYLRKIGRPLERGDLIKFRLTTCSYILRGYGNVTYYPENRGTCIFDGKKIINLEQFPSKLGCIPKHFQVIDEFPITYWHSTCT